MPRRSLAVPTRLRQKVVTVAEPVTAWLSGSLCVCTVKVWPVGPGVRSAPHPPRARILEARASRVVSLAGLAPAQTPTLSPLT